MGIEAAGSWMNVLTILFSPLSFGVLNGTSAINVFVVVLLVGFAAVDVAEV